MSIRYAATLVCLSCCLVCFSHGQMLPERRPTTGWDGQTGTTGSPTAGVTVSPTGTPVIVVDDGLTSRNADRKYQTDDSFVMPDAGQRSQTRDQKLPALPPVPEPLSEFQQFVADSIGRPLPVFGHNLFTDVPSTFAQADRIPVPASYVIGPGDELLIRAWGQVEINARVVVDRNGGIFLPKVGTISVTGIRYDQLDGYLRTAVGRVFRNFDLTATMGQLRSIQIFVVGHARRPGAYTVSSLSTLVNALFASGGPSVSGSMRHIQLRRDSRTISDFDLYHLLLKGDKSNDVTLMPGDVVYIPPVGPQVALAGSVTLPAIYELRSVAALGEVLESSGGLTNVADGGRVIVERIEGRASRQVEEFKLDDSGLKRELKDGDLVRVFSITPKFDNAVTIRGNVAQPGRYPWHEGMRVRDLIPNREFLLTRRYWQERDRVFDPARGGGPRQDWQERDGAFGPARGGRTRQNWQEFDGVFDSAKAPRIQGENLDNSTADVTANGIPNRESLPARQSWQQRDGAFDPTRGVFKQGESLVSLMTDRRTPEINWDYALIQRMNPVDLSSELIPFSLEKAIAGESDADNVILRAGDIVTIFSQADVAVGVDRQTKLVRLEGEFRIPGLYRVQPGETLRTLAARAGGLSEKAYLFAAQFSRESARQEQQKSLDRMVRDMEVEVERGQMNALGTAVESPDKLQLQAASRKAIIERLRTLKATGRVVLELRPGDRGVEALPEIVLEDGDRLYIPSTPATVSVAGAVYNQSSFLFKGTRRVGDYVKMAGSGTREADMKHAFVVRADGSVISERSLRGQSVMSARSLPGDVIVVPAQLEKGAFMRNLKEWSQVLSQFGIAAAGINVLK